MKYKLLVSFSFVVVLVASLIAHVPISWVWQQMPQVRGLTLSGLDGTPWQGSAAQIVWQGQNFGRVQWQMDIAALLSAQAAFDVRFGQGSDLNLIGRGRVGYRAEGPFAENLLVSLPAQQAMAYARVPVPISLAGNLELTVRDYQYQAPFCDTLNGTLAWTSGGITTPMGALNPGSALADLSCAQGKVVASANQSSPDVSSQWQAELTPSRQYVLNGWFKPGAAFPAQLGQQLKWLGNPDPKGRYQLNYRGRL
ncbi:type II secretion system protein N [Photobacterium atrarenae]|uniref:Type II secretion system protein N n=1 Tax=Photobacterium atrarenae TaxID=865757 RepID=A0ABY5GFM5_9GAMM|nr:type II secretion system protein N [Photobacterium atrarenae]UTV27626.1 type II secretion system protein N [Photobacterium atrarenae]